MAEKVKEVEVYMFPSHMKGHVVNALRMTGFSSDMVKKVLKNLEKSIVALPNDAADSMYAKTKLS